MTSMWPVIVKPLMCTAGAPGCSVRSEESTAPGPAAVIRISLGADSAPITEGNSCVPAKSWTLSTLPRGAYAIASARDVPGSISTTWAGGGGEGGGGEGGGLGGGEGGEGGEGGGGEGGGAEGGGGCGGGEGGGGDGAIMIV